MRDYVTPGGTICTVVVLVFIMMIQFFFLFTVRRSALHGLCDRNSVRPSVRLSVCLSVCLSHSWTVSTWFDLRS